MMKRNKREYTVRIRKDMAEVRPEASQLEGQSFWFYPGWGLDDDTIYPDETAMVPDDRNYPRNAPPWIASGDLEPTQHRIQFEDLNPTPNGRYYNLIQLVEKIREIPKDCQFIYGDRGTFEVSLDKVGAEFLDVELEEGIIWMNLRWTDTPVGHLYHSIHQAFPSEMRLFPCVSGEVCEETGKVDVGMIVKIVIDFVPATPTPDEWNAPAGFTRGETWIGGSNATN